MVADLLLLFRSAPTELREVVDGIHEFWRLNRPKAMPFRKDSLLSCSQLTKSAAITAALSRTIVPLLALHGLVAPLLALRGLAAPLLALRGPSRRTAAPSAPLWGPGVP